MVWMHRVAERAGGHVRFLVGENSRAGRKHDLLVGRVKGRIYSSSLRAREIIRECM